MQQAVGQGGWGGVQQAVGKGGWGQGCGQCTGPVQQASMSGAGKAPVQQKKKVMLTKLTKKLPDQTEAELDLNDMVALPYPKKIRAGHGWRAITCDYGEGRLSMLYL